MVSSSMISPRIEIVIPNLSRLIVPLAAYKWPDSQAHFRTLPSFIYAPSGQTVHDRYPASYDRSHQTHSKGHSRSFLP